MSVENRNVAISDATEAMRVLFVIAEERIDEYLGVSYLMAALGARGIRSNVLQWSKPSSRSELDALLAADTGIVLIGIPWLYIFSERRVTELAAHIKTSRPDIKVVVGGHPPTFEYERILRSYTTIDFVLRGEADESIVELAASLCRGEAPSQVRGLAYRSESGRIVAVTPRPQISDLDALPFPTRHTLAQAIEHYGGSAALTARVLSSRGCYARCEFCSMVPFYSIDGQGMRWRPRGPAGVVAELSQLVQRHGVRAVWFVDDEFIGPPHVGVPRVLELATLIVRSGFKIEFGFDARANGICALSPSEISHLREAGLRVVSMGVESGSQAALDRMNKGLRVEDNWEAVRRLRAAHIEHRFGFVMYDPATTLDDLHSNLAFLRFADPHRICNTGPYRLLNAEFPELGTPLFRRLGKTMHDVNIDDSRDFPRVHEYELGYTFGDRNVSRYRRLLRQIASEVVESVMVPRRLNEVSLDADMWVGVNNVPQNVAAMRAFLSCHEWLLERIEDQSLDDRTIIGRLKTHFYQQLSGRV